MTHCIIVKWLPDADKADFAAEVRELFGNATKVAGVLGVEIKENVIPRDNRYDLAIMLHMDKNALSTWDDSALHKTWKAEFGKYIDKKCIFDYE